MRLSIFPLATLIAGSVTARAETRWSSARKEGVGTSTSLSSRVWFTLEGGQLSEVFWPQVDQPALARFEVRVDGEDGARARTVALAERSALVWRQTEAVPGKWLLTKTTYSDPARDAVLIDVVLSGSEANRPVEVVMTPALRGGPESDRAQHDAQSLAFFDRGTACAVVGMPALSVHGDVARLSSPRTTLALGFGASVAQARAVAQAALETRVEARRAYVSGWRSWLQALKRPRHPNDAPLYDVALMTIRAHEDKTFRGASVASLSMPWASAKAASEERHEGYYFVWARDLYQMATALLAAGDRPAAERALGYLLGVQQREDGSFPQNSWLDGRPHWKNLQLDEVAFPIVLAHELGRFDRATWDRVRRSADLLVARGPRTSQERWEEQEGYSPSTIAAEIAGLVCAGDWARRQNDERRAALYEAVADAWRDGVRRWLVTSTGRHGRRYFLRIGGNENPDDGETVALQNGGGKHDERDIVDAGFLELVRLGIFAPDDPDIAASIKVVDRVLRVETPAGPLFYRYNHDGYGETQDGQPWLGAGVGRLWPILAGERGEYELAAGRDARPYLAAMTRSAGPSGMLPEQVWDGPEPTRAGWTFGQGTASATPLAWSAAGYVRLALGTAAGRALSRPEVVVRRYAGRSDKAAPTLIIESEGMPLPVEGVVEVQGHTSAPRVLLAAGDRTVEAHVQEGRFWGWIEVPAGAERITTVAIDGGSATWHPLAIKRPAR